jgi:hypothetical protein
MRKIYILLLIVICQYSFGQNNVGIGIATPNPSAILDLTSASQGFLAPRMAAAQRLAISAPATGLMVFDTDTGCVFFYTGLSWKNLCVSTSAGGYNDSIFFNPVGTVSVQDGGGVRTSVLGGWLSNGNTGTTAGVNFAGTTDAQDFVLKSNNTEVMRATTNVAVGINQPAPAVGAVLDVVSTSKGVLIPRTQVALITTPSLGLLIFDTDTNCFCYYTGAAWKSLCSASQNAWQILGNSGTNSTVNFAGTTDAQDFVLKSNNTEVMRATTAGAVGINQPAPNANAILDIQSSAKGILVPSLTSAERDAIVGPVAGLTIYNNTINVHQFWNGTCWVNVGQTVCSFSYSVNYLTATHTSDCLFVSNFSSVSDTIQVNLVNGTPSPVILTAVGVPAGVIVSFSNNYLLPPQQSIMTFTALPSAPSGTYTITVLATSGSTVQTLTYSLSVFGYNLSVTPFDTTVSAGNLTNGGYISQAVVAIGNVSACQASLNTAVLSATGAPGTINVSFASNTIPMPGSTIMTITSNCPLPGTYPITVQALIGVVTTTATYTLTITPLLAVHITSNQTNLDLSTYFGNGHCAGNDTVIIDPGVTVCSSNPSLPALTTGVLPTGSLLTIINNGSIIGAGGAGGSDPANAAQSPCPTADGGNGGDAIFVAFNVPTKIINNGTIASGGGGGGAGQALTGTNLSALCNFSFNNAFVGGSGGGGAGCSPGAGGTNSSCNLGSPGTATTGGAGGAAPSTQNGCGCNVNVFGIVFSANAGGGGGGGNLGQPGNPGGSFNDPGGVTLSTSCPAGQGGAAGYSVNGNGCGCASVVGGGSLVGPTRP